MKHITKSLIIGLVVLGMSACASSSTPPPTLPPETPTPRPTEVPIVPEAASVVEAGDILPPVLTTPCAPGSCLFEGQEVTVIVSFGGGEKGPISGPLYEIQQEFESATGARLEIIERPLDEHFPYFMTDLTTGTGRYDASLAAAWWLGDLASQDFIIPYDDYYDDPRFPHWDIEDVQPALRSLLEYDGKHYMIANDHDGMVMYYRRDLFSDPVHKAAFEAEYGYPLDVPQTWEEFRDIAEYFDGKDLNGDNEPDDGLTMHLKAGGQGMFHFIAFSAPFVIGPDNPSLYWFDPDTMEPLLSSPGHVRALELMVELVKFGPKEMLDWDLGQSWDHFLLGRAALTFTWGDLGALAQQEGSAVKGNVGVAQLPGTLEYYDIQSGQWKTTEQPNLVGNTVGGSWAGVISKYSDAPEATYYLLALMAMKDKSLVYAARGWDGVDPGRYSHYLLPDGSADIANYLAAGWDAVDIQLYSQAYYDTFDNELQSPYLRIPGTYSYLSTLDIYLYQAAQGQLSAEEALRAAVLEFDVLTNRLGRAQQAEVYRASLGF